MHFMIRVFGKAAFDSNLQIKKIFFEHYKHKNKTDKQRAPLENRNDLAQILAKDEHKPIFSHSVEYKCDCYAN